MTTFAPARDEIDDKLSRVRTLLDARSLDAPARGARAHRSRQKIPSATAARPAR